MQDVQPIASTAGSRLANEKGGASKCFGRFGAVHAVHAVTAVHAASEAESLLLVLSGVPQLEWVQAGILQRAEHDVPDTPECRLDAGGLVLQVRQLQQEVPELL